MLRSSRLALGLALLAASLLADDQAIWREYGLVQTQNTTAGKLAVTTHQMKDLTGALAAWEWLRSPKGRSCNLAQFCTQDGNRTIIADNNYLVIFDGGVPTQAQVDAVLNSLSNKRDTSLPAILTFLPTQGLVPDSARYILGPASLQAFAPELQAAHPGLEQGAEAQVAEYKVPGGQEPVRLAVFYYPTPEMARLHAAAFEALPNTHVKRSDVLVAVVFGAATDAQAERLLSRIEYEAKVIWNETPPPSPIKPLLQLLTNIIYLSIVLSAACLLGGLIYGAMRIYRRRYGTLEEDESMITLRLSGN